MAQKEFGRYSSADLAALSEFTKSLEAEFFELRELLAKNPDKLEDQLTPPFYWSTFYSVPLLELLAAQIQLLGVAAQFSEISKSSDPHKELLEAIPGIELGGEREDAKYILGISMALRGNLRSIGFYSKTLEELTREVEQGSDQAFFDAVLVDKTILTCPPFADRMALAEYRGEETFFQTLSKRLRQGAPTKKAKMHMPLRVCLYALEDEGCLATLSEKRAHELFVEELQLYSTQDDTSRSLMRLIQRWRKDRAT